MIKLRIGTVLGDYEILDLMILMKILRESSKNKKKGDGKDV